MDATGANSTLGIVVFVVFLIVLAVVVILTFLANRSNVTPLDHLQFQTLFHVPSASYVSFYNTLTNPTATPGLPAYTPVLSVGGLVTDTESLWTFTQGPAVAEGTLYALQSQLTTFYPLPPMGSPYIIPLNLAVEPAPTSMLLFQPVAGMPEHYTIRTNFTGTNYKVVQAGSNLTSLLVVQPMTSATDVGDVFVRAAGPTFS